MLHAWANSAQVHYVAPQWRETGGLLLAEGALRELRAAGPGGCQNAEPIPPPRGSS